MGKFETNQIDVMGDGNVILYLRPDVVSNPKYQARISVDGATGYKRFSTKTADENEAKRIATQKYFELKNKVDLGGGLEGKTIKQIFVEWAEYIKTRNVNRTNENVQKNTIDIVEKTFVEFLGKKRIDDLKNRDIQDFITWRYTDDQYDKRKNIGKQSTKSKSPKGNTGYSISTLRNHRSAINQYLKFCKERDYTSQQFTFDIPKGKSSPRPEFTKDEWRKLTTFMRSWVNEDSSNQHKGKFKNPRYYRDRFYLQQYILILGNTGIRIGEARNLRWIDLTPLTLDDGEMRVLLSVDGKTGKRDVVCNPNTETYFKRLMDFRVEELGIDKENFNMKENVFCKKDGSPVQSFKSGFISLLEKCDLRVSKSGEYRTIYSLRHTYATQRINEVSVYQLSVNMGTSVKMIEEFYSHAKVKDPEFAKSITKGNQKGSSEIPSFLK